MGTLLRNSAYHELRDWLPRGGMFRKKRFFQLRGVMLIQKEREDESAQAELRLCIFNCAIVERKSKMQIEIKDYKFTLFFADLYTFDRWSNALQQAASRRLKDYYVQDRKVDAGASATVYRGFTRTEKETEVVAIKCIDKSHCTPHEVEQLEREAAIVMIANHPDLIATYDIFETLESVYLVMEYMEAGTLADILERHGTFSEDEVRELMRPLLRAIVFLHSVGVVHRDIKPENVLCQSDTRPFGPKLSDFGLGGILPPELLSLDDEDVAYFTETLGSWYYISPEQCRKEKYGLKVDVWALGVTMYQLLTGRQPFEGHGVPDVIRAILEGNQDMDAEPWPSISEGAKDLVQKMLTIDSSYRCSAEDALRHPWIQATEEDLVALEEFGSNSRASLDMAMYLISASSSARNGRQRRSIQHARESVERDEMERDEAEGKAREVAAEEKRKEEWKTAALRSITNTLAGEKSPYKLGGALSPPDTSSTRSPRFVVPDSRGATRGRAQPIGVLLSREGSAGNRAKIPAFSKRSSSNKEPGISLSIAELGGLKKWGPTKAAAGGLATEPITYQPPLIVPEYDEEDDGHAKDAHTPNRRHGLCLSDPPRLTSSDASLLAATQAPASESRVNALLSAGRMVPNSPLSSSPVVHAGSTRTAKPLSPNRPQPEPKLLKMGSTSDAVSLAVLKHDRTISDRVRDVAAARTLLLDETETEEDPNADSDPDHIDKMDTRRDRIALDMRRGLEDEQDSMVSRGMRRSISMPSVEQARSVEAHEHARGSPFRLATKTKLFRRR
ncbi:Myosin light chain kinase A [Porphyridium purpureum]|uniref:Myosin light chain kinase A n=1 Tax=Porphyridium purpureum TaxID=35688 RepID=A0A5J4YLK9_PORPP|nr:Myosin light chain kinase A [Porphyridium purpureum]|eukprot:POR1762..scf295_9